MVGGYADRMHGPVGRDQSGERKGFPPSCFPNRHVTAPPAEPAASGAFLHPQNGDNDRTALPQHPKPL